MSEIAPISAIIPTCDRREILLRTLANLGKQSLQPCEIIINDASCDDRPEAGEWNSIPGLLARVRWHRARAKGAAPQRNEALGHAAQPWILFMDDDILLEPECLARLWRALQSDPALGGVNTMITNQSYQPPGRLSGALFRFLHGSPALGYAGKWLGGVLNLLPEDRDDLPEVVPVQWLNTTCTLYRREALPAPPFPAWFRGYSLSEDLMLSLEVQKRGWKVANARSARIFHDSQPGSHKSHQAEVVAMEIHNGWRIGMAHSSLSKFRLAVNLAAVQGVKLLASLSRPADWGIFFARLRGNILGWWQVLTWSRDGAMSQPSQQP